jgi:hypothetical protein
MVLHELASLSNYYHAGFCTQMLLEGNISSSREGKLTTGPSTVPFGLVTICCMVVNSG